MRLPPLHLFVLDRMVAVAKKRGRKKKKPDQAATPRLLTHLSVDDLQEKPEDRCVLPRFFAPSLSRARMQLPSSFRTLFFSRVAIVCAAGQAHSLC